MFISPASTSPAIFALLPIKYRSLSNAFNPLSSIDNVPNPIVNLFNFSPSISGLPVTKLSFNTFIKFPPFTTIPYGFAITKSALCPTTSKLPNIADGLAVITSFNINLADFFSFAKFLFASISSFIIWLLVLPVALFITAP